MAALPQSPPASTSEWQGRAQLVYGVRGGRTVPVTAYAQAPLRLQKPLSGQDEPCQSVLVHTAGGLVGGDRLDINIHLQSGSEALVTTAAASKVYRCPNAAARQRVHLHLEANTCLEWLPQEAILFNGARYRQDIRVELAPGALWLGWDIMRFGRSARGERFDQGDMRSHTEVWQAGQPIWGDRQFLIGGSPVLDSPHGLAGYPVVGTLALVGRSPESEHIAQARQLWDCQYSGDVGVTQLQSGLICRYRGPSSQQARRWFVAIWQQLRPWYLQRPVAVPRIWMS
ncbi:urease accessory protein [filamentous cyanobacterium CCP5]|nr:urease accessory protein [filamentous cyanobacterium CCP5]